MRGGRRRGRRADPVQGHRAACPGAGRHHGGPVPGRGQGLEPRGRLRSRHQGRPRQHGQHPARRRRPDGHRHGRARCHGGRQGQGRAADLDRRPVAPHRPRRAGRCERPDPHRGRPARQARAAVCRQPVGPLPRQLPEEWRAHPQRPDDRLPGCRRLQRRLRGRPGRRGDEHRPYVLPVIGDRRPSRVIDAAEYGCPRPAPGSMSARRWCRSRPSCWAGS